jgi:hypothetical protein
MRNRWYSPQLGRPFQMDLNESASLVLAALAMNGETLGNFVSAFAATGHYGDGMNLYQYAGGNPVNRLDALGLSLLDTLGAAAGQAALGAMVFMEAHSTAFGLIGNVLIAMNLYAMATDPEYAMIMTSAPGAAGMLNYDIQQLLRFGTSLRASANAAMSSELLAWRVAQGSQGIRARCAGWRRVVGVCRQDRLVWRDGKADPRVQSCD